MEEETPIYELLVPYLRSCKKEVLWPLTGDVKGNIPPWLQGTLLRVGSGLLDARRDRYNNIADGVVLMHKFAIEGGKVTYENRFLKSDISRNNNVFSERGSAGRPDPCKTIFQRFSSLFSTKDVTDNDIVNFIKYTDEIYACSENNSIWKVDPVTLQYAEKVDLKKFVLLNTASAHPHEDTDGIMYNIGYGFLPKPSYVFIKFPTKGERAYNPFLGGSVVGKVPATHPLHPGYFHSFGMSRNYFISVEQSLEMSVPKLLHAHHALNAFAESMKWVPERQTLFHVVRRDTGEELETKYVTDPFVIFHHINAYEEDNHLVVDICWCPDGQRMKSLYVDALRELYSSGKEDAEMMLSFGRRFVFPLDTKNNKKAGTNLVTLENCEARAIVQKDGSVFCESEPLIENDAWASEMPRLNYELCNMRKYRYYYSLGKRPDAVKKTAVLKVDIEKKTVLHWEEDGTLPSEPVFVASPDSSEEDNGVVLVSLLSKTSLRKVTLLVLDAKDMTELARADFQADSTIPGDFHGLFTRAETSEDETE